MSKKLGPSQLSVLKVMLRDGGYPGRGWSWGTNGQTIDVLESLVRRGLVHREERTLEGTLQTYDFYDLTEDGRLEAQGVNPPEGRRS